MAPDLMAWLAASDYPHAQPVHRLDLGVSGVLLCALTKESRTQLGKQLEAQGVGKAIGPRRGLPSEKDHSHFKDARRKKSISATTRYARLESFSPDYSLLSVTLETGRKHDPAPSEGIPPYRGRSSISWTTKSKPGESTHRIWLRQDPQPTGWHRLRGAPAPRLEDDLASLRSRYPDPSAETR